MDWLNYHHLRYFWEVAREGSIARAAERLRLAPPTLSAQIRTLEEHLGEQLFHRRGRSLVLTEVGQTVLGYAEDIFTLGQELTGVLAGGATGHPLRLNVGVTDVVAKLVVRAILKPAFELDLPVRVVCREGPVERLIADLATYRLDLVLSDGPAPATVRVKTYSRQLGECGLTFLAARRVAARLKRGFPQSLDGVPALLPTPNTGLRRNLDTWFAGLDIRPEVVAEFEDSALLFAFAADELGVFPVPTVIADEIARRYDAGVVGRTEECREHVYAITAERKVKHAAVAAITAAARDNLL